ncbi:unnamed protein product [Chrysoparadoxa australica]
MVAFIRAFKTQESQSSCYGGAKDGTGAMSTEQWWTNVVRDTIASTGAPTSGEVWERIFHELYSEVYTGKRGWQLASGAEDTLAALRAWCPGKIGVLSNTDERLLNILANLGVDKLLDFVVTSRDVGYEKPSPEIFKSALDAAGMDPSTKGLHIGDSYKHDVAGAHAAGWSSVLVCSKAKQGQDLPHLYCDCFSDVPEVLGLTALQKNQLAN